MTEEKTEQTEPESPSATPKGKKTAAELLEEGKAAKSKAKKSSKGKGKKKAAKTGDKPKLSGWAALKKSLPDEESAKKRLRELQAKAKKAETDKTVKAPSAAYIKVIERLVAHYNPNKKPRGKGKKKAAKKSE